MTSENLSVSCHNNGRYPSVALVALFTQPTRTSTYWSV